MSRDEALNKTIGILTYHQLNFCKSKEAVANMNEIIEALEKIDQEPCGDCISRESVNDLVRELGNILNGTENKRDVSTVLTDILYLPPVTPQQKMGRWVMSDDGLYRPICNNCGAHPWKGYIPTVEEATEAFKYCPNCGAKMQEV